MLIAQLLTLALVATIAVWLWRQESAVGRFLLALGGVFALTLIQIVAPFGVGWLVVLQAGAWTLLLWGGGMAVAAVPVLFLAAVLGLLFPQDVWTGLVWGLAAVLPPLTWIYQSRSASASLPPEPASPAPPLFAPPSTTGAVTAVFGDQRQLLHYVDEGVVVSDANGSVEFANQPALNMLGVPADEMIGQSIIDLLARLPMLGSMGENKPRVQFEMNGRLLEGRIDVMYDNNGRALGSIAVLRDITDAFQSQRAKDAFLTTISHELRTPLTAIKGYTEMLTSDVVGPLNTEQHQFMEIIQRNVTRMVQLVNSMIFVSAVRGGRVEAKRVYADLRQLVNQIVRELEPVATRSQQTFEVSLDTRLKPIQADSIHVSTMLQELINNSLKYNQPGGVVRISVVLEAGEFAEAEFAVVRVSDNGIGISSEEQKYIFDDFYRADKNDTNLQVGGMGVGLSIVRALVEAYNGRIWLESTPGQGSTFTFILPARQVDNRDIG
jgi:signal transduction histidine kinase